MSKYVGFIIIVAVVVGGAVWYFMSDQSNLSNDNTNTATNTVTNTATSNTNAVTSNTNIRINTNTVTTNANASNATNTNSADTVSYTVTMKNYSFTPSQLTAKVGQTVKVTVVNNGDDDHDFIIDELGVDSGSVAPGGTKLLTFSADTAGTYPIYCGIGSHRDFGMEGTLVVE